MINILPPINIFKREQKLKLLFVASEAAPFVKIGRFDLSTPLAFFSYRWYIEDKFKERRFGGGAVFL